MNYHELIKIYDNSWMTGTVAPIAHIMTRAKIGVLLSSNGQLMAAKKMDEVVPIPCTIQSGGRTSNVAPHAIHDNITYLSETSGKKDRHTAYMSQLRKYIAAKEDPLAMAVYRYISRGTIRMELQSILNNIPISESACIAFALPEMENTINVTWLNWYVSSLPKNGVCEITGEPDYIPDTYPRGIRNPLDLSRLFMAEGGRIMELDSMPRVTAGYIATQKITHVLQSMMWAGNGTEMA